MIPNIAPPPQPALATRWDDIATAYRAMGVTTVPVAGKKPLVRWHPYATRPPTDAEQHAIPWTAASTTGLAAVLGDASGGLACRDYDTPEAYAEMLHRYPAVMAYLPTVKTPRGYHVYFRTMGGTKTQKLGDGEVRSQNAIVVLPPSRHPSGGQYRWLHGTLKQVPTVSPAFFVGGINWQAELAAVSPAVSPAPTVPVPVSAAPTHTLIPPTPPATIHIPTPIPTTTTNYVPMKSLGHINMYHGSDAENIDVWAMHLPQKPGQRNHCILALVRFVKTDSRYIDADVSDLAGGFKRWHELALPNIKTKDFNVSWQDFRAAWRLYRPGKYGLAKAVSAAEAMPPLILEDMGLSKLAGVCRALQGQRKNFYISSRIAARIIGLTYPMAGHRAIEKLILLGHIKLVRRGKRGLYHHRANRYRWVGPPA